MSYELAMWAMWDLLVFNYKFIYFKNISYCIMSNVINTISDLILVCSLERNI